MKRLKVMLSLMAALVAAGMMTACSGGDPDPQPPKISAVTPATGPTAGGTAVTITGTNLTGTHAVAFGGALATGVTVVNDTTVTCVTPAHDAGAVEVTLAATGGTVGRLNGYTYIAPPGSFNFNGTWAYSGTVVQSSFSTIPVGRRLSDTAVITATDPNIRIAVPNAYVITGTCNTAAGIYDAQGTYRGIAIRQVGSKTGSTSMEGDETWANSAGSLAIHWTMRRTSSQTKEAPDSAPGISLGELEAKLQGLR